MIRDSRGFEFSRLNSLLSWAFFWQDKKIKINETVNGYVTFNVKLICTLSTELCWLFSFSRIDSFPIKPTYSKNLFLEFPKNIKSSIILLMYLTLLATFRIIYCVFTKYATHKFRTKQQSISMSWYELHLVYLTLNAET